MKLTIDIELEDLNLEDARALWSDEYNGGVSMTNAQLKTSVQDFCSDSISGRLSMLKQDAIRKNPGYVKKSAL